MAEEDISSVSILLLCKVCIYYVSIVYMLFFGVVVY